MARSRDRYLRRLKKRTLSETTEDDAMDVDAGVPADDADDQQVIDTLDDQIDGRPRGGQEERSLGQER